jgi:hypothetical protein
MFDVCVVGDFRFAMAKVEQAIISNFQKSQKTLHH